MAVHSGQRCLPSISSIPSPLLGLFFSPATGCGVRFPLLARLNIPAPVVGGLLVAIAMTVAHRTGTQLLRFDTTLQTPLQNAFFTSIGFGASFQLLRLGGPLVLRFFLFATAVAVLQNVVGAAAAAALGQPRCSVCWPVRSR